MQIQQITQSFMKAAIDDVMEEEPCALQEDKDKDSGSSSSASSDSDDDKHKKRHGKHKKRDRESKGKKHKDIKKNDKHVGGLPRKCFKRLIKKELDKQCQQIFNNLMNCPEIGEN